MLNSVTNKITTTPTAPPSSKKQITGDFNSVLATQTKQTSVAPQSAENIIAAATTLKIPVDFTNMTPNEFGELTKSGRFPELPPLVLPKGGWDPTKDFNQQVETLQNTKVNYIDLVQKEIDFNKIVGMPTEYLDKQLNLMKNFNA